MSEPAPVVEGPRVVPPALHGARLDRATAQLFELPVATARRLLALGRVRLDGKRGAKGDPVRSHQSIALEGGARWLTPAAAPRLTLVHTDEELVVVDKPAGMPCHPLVPGEGGTVVDALAALFPEIERASPEAPREAGLVHRLDTGTSGCLAVARTEGAWRALRAAVASDQADKRYLALVEGVLAAPRTISAPIAHDPSDARRMRCGPEGRPASSVVLPLAQGRDATLVELVLGGGRRHQLRVHLASIGHPIVGDELYGAPARAGVAWPLLHALSLLLPGRARVEAPPPSSLLDAARARGLAVEQQRH
ncbi:MAG: RluA family pseudouridine synthase [Deltaproteobacteria bacterium]|nr:RluA family pseudouridine synthase [Deltaproteobacteria bacterium]